MLILGKKMGEIDNSPKKPPKTDLEVSQKQGPNLEPPKTQVLVQLTTFVHNAYLCIKTLCQFKVDSFKKTFDLVSGNVGLLSIELLKLMLIT